MLPYDLLPKDDRPFLPEPLDNYLHPGRKLYFINSSQRLFLLRALEKSVEQHVARKDLECLVDFGCGQMPYRSLFEPHLKSYIGVDIEGNAAADIKIRPGARVPMDDGSADVVLSSQVLEHVPTVGDYLCECSRLLKRGGKLILTTHGIYNWHPAPMDLRRWTWQGLEYEITQAGLEMAQIVPVGGPVSAGIGILLRLLSDCVPKIRKLRPAILMPSYVAGNLLVRLLEPITPLRAKYYNCQILLCVAVKPPAGSGPADESGTDDV